MSLLQSQTIPFRRKIPDHLVGCFGLKAQLEKNCRQLTVLCKRLARQTAADLAALSAIEMLATTPKRGMARRAEESAHALDILDRCAEMIGRLLFRKPTQRGMRYRSHPPLSLNQQPCR
jgi:hypothetical protein